MSNFYEKLINILKEEDNFIDENNDLIKNEIINSSLKGDRKLIQLLVKDEQIKKLFFSKVDEYLIFDFNKFINYMDQKDFLDNSFTKFKNRIGLNIDNKFLNERGEVSLVWPYKDCVLEGGMTKEDKKRNEIFFNETLAQDEIDRLFDKKVLTNFKRYDTTGEHEVLELKESDNLIIKGNNLLALHSLKEWVKKQGGVKLIYIDPPYNTENDGFRYNDRFNHSTWLTFMKNRLELARELLSDDGTIYINIDYNEAHYLKVLMDEVFGRDNFITQIIWRMGFLSGYKTKAKKYIRNYDTILFYSKTKNYFFNKLYIPNEDFAPLLTNSEIEKAFKNFSFDKNLVPDFAEFINHTNRGERYPLEDTWNCNKWDRLNSIAIDSSVSRVDETMELGGENFKGQKPESLLQRIILSSTNENDLVLDFHLGTGTTVATAHKLNRKYIGIEQMEYIDLTVERMKNVIVGEQGGISKLLNWEGGGSFVYCELMEFNEEAMNFIQKSKNNEEIMEIWESMYKRYFLNYNLEINKFNENLDEFKSWSLDEQKKILCEMLNKNQLYVNLSEINDSQVNINENVKKLNKSFYGDYYV
ncbi:MAG: site-specific DNA-methyltransferase [Methanobrevibacter sp.]|jgi:adenine-specific DNA-methyltransferase|nr:site-specific DNA-methyltransferase [Methanobrevibacter sp.]